MIVGPVVRVEVIPRHPPQVALPPDHRIAVGMHLEGEGVDLLLKVERREVLRALTFRDDDRPLALYLSGIEERMAHPIGLEVDDEREMLGRQDLMVGGVILGGEGVPVAAQPLDRPRQPPCGVGGGAFEQHGLAPVGAARPPPRP